jgi:hypothetical protein
LATGYLIEKSSSFVTEDVAFTLAERAALLEPLALAGPHDYPQLLG